VNEIFSRLSHLVPPVFRLRSFHPRLLLCVALAGAGKLAAEAPPPLAAPKPATPPVSVAPAMPPIPPSAAASVTPTGDASGTAPLPADVIAKATARLKDLVARQDALIAALGKEDTDMDNVKRDIQTLIFDYDGFLRSYPTFAPGYVTYGLLLGKVGMRRAAASILLKANQLDPNLPLVKNQLGNYLAEEGEPVEAVNYFLSAIQLAPNEPLYHYQLGTLLTEARDDFLQSGLWTRAQIDQTMQDAFKHAAELAPDNIPYAYCYAFSFYDLAEPRWDEALKLWGALEDRVSPGLEKETIRLQAANILIKQQKFDHARVLLATVTTPTLQKQKQELLNQLPAEAEK
jgi:tetratricopeptide (TPR) repeat protein